MRAFVLSTGRSGSTTFARACDHLTNYTAGHETNSRHLDGRLDYPDWHIEVDNRLTWFLGALGNKYPGALYVHLTRDPDKVAASFLRRWDQGAANIIRAFAHGIVTRGNPYNEKNRLKVCRLYVDTVNANIASFVRGRAHIRVAVESAASDFPVFLHRIDASGNLEAAVREWTVIHNASQHV